MKGVDCKSPLNALPKCSLSLLGSCFVHDLIFVRKSVFEKYSHAHL